MLRRRKDILQACRRAHAAKDDEITLSVSEALPDVIDLSRLSPSDFENLSYVLKSKRSIPLTRLVLRFHKLQPSTTALLAESIHNFKEVKLFRCDFKDNALEIICEKIKCLQKPLNKLHITNSCIGAIGAVSLAGCIHNIEEVDLSWNNIGGHGVEILSKKIEDLPKPLKKLCISHNEIGEIGAVSLADCIHNIEEVDLSWNTLGNHSLKILSAKIKEMQKPLRKLCISHNEIGEIGAFSLADCIHNIAEVDLSFNNLGIRGVKILSQRINSLKKPATILNLSANHSVQDEFDESTFLFSSDLNQQSLPSSSHSSGKTGFLKFTKEKLSGKNLHLKQETLLAENFGQKNTDEYELKLETSSVVGVEGGKLNVMSCVLDIPPKALSSDVEIRVTSYYGKTQPSREITPLLCCEPNGQNFAEDVSITLPTCFTNYYESKLVVVRTSEDGTSWKDYQTFPIANKREFTFTVTHFSWYVVEIIGSLIGWTREKRVMGGFPNNDPPERVERLWKCLVYDNFWHEHTGVKNLEQLLCCNARSHHRNVRLKLHSPSGKITFEENLGIFESFYSTHMHQFQTVFKFAPHSGYQMIKLGLEFDDCNSETSFGIQVETIPQELPQEQTRHGEGRQEAPQSAQSTENISISGADIKDCRIGGKTVVNQFSVNVHPGASLQLPSTSGGQLQLQHATERLAIKDASEEDEN